MKRLGLRILTRLGAYPHIFFTYSPFKILEFRALTDGIDWRGDERVLDIGCGNGLQTFLLGRSCGEVVGVDISAAAIAEARWLAGLLAPRIRSRFLASTLPDADLPPASFDHVFSICVLEHIGDHAAVLAEAFRLLKPGATIHVSVDALESIPETEIRERHRAQHQVAVYFRRDSLAEALESAGFREVRVRPLFRSALARRCFLRGIARGFNFGRLRAPWLASRLRRAEATAALDAPGLFLLGTARKP